MNAALLSDLRFAYEDELIFEGFSLSVRKGRVTALLGPNGAGKSTLLALILGYLTPESGSVSVFGKELPLYTRRELGKLIGFVSQTGSLPFNYSVEDYILLGRGSELSLWAQPSENDRGAARQAAEKAGAAWLLERNVQELSAGELQLVQISRALAQEPRILLLDEPTSHLDPANALGIFRLMRQLAETGITVLFTTHDPLHARQAADDAVLIKKGQVLFSGSAETTLTAATLQALYGIEFKEAVYKGEKISFIEF